jgi:hypothetical protein
MKLIFFYKNKKKKNNLKNITLSKETTQDE